MAVTAARTRTQHDFTVNLLRIVGGGKGTKTVALQKATWPRRLHLAIAKAKQASSMTGRSD